MMDIYETVVCGVMKLIFIDKMSAQIIYANGVTANYSLTTYSPYEGWQIAFNGMKGRIETWEDIPYLQKTPMTRQSVMLLK